MIDKVTVSPTSGPRTDIQVKVSVAGSEVVSSGTIVTKRQYGLTISLAGLTYEFIFEDDGDSHEIAVNKIGEKSVQFRLIKFDNVLGTSVNFIKVGEVAGSPLWLSLYVEAVGDDIRVVSYTLYLGGNFDG